MKQIVKTFLASALAALMVGAVALPAQSACLSPGEIRDALASGQILSSPQIYAAAGVGPRTGREVLDASVCERGGQLYYRLVIFDKNTSSRTELEVNASTGAS